MLKLFILFLGCFSFVFSGQNELDLEKFFPLTEKRIEEEKTSFIKWFDQSIEDLINGKWDKSALYAFDKIFGSVGFEVEKLEGIAYVHPDVEICKIASAAGAEVSNRGSETLYNHPELYTILSSIDQNTLNENEKYFLKEVLIDLETLGLGLPENERENIKRLGKELSNLGNRFSFNIRNDNTTIKVSYDELKGMEEEFVQNLEKDDEGMFLLNTSYPIALPILKNCIVESTRKKMHNVFSNRAYPENDELLKNILEKRQELANKLGFPSYAHMQLKSEMVQTPEKAKAFLEEMKTSFSPIQDKENALLIQTLPEDVSANKEGKIAPWNVSYALSHINKTLFDIDTESLKAYFPLDNTLQKLFDVYEKFFDIRIEEIPCPKLWHEDVRLVQIKSSDSKKILGNILLDLHPRKGKYTHACCGAINPSLEDEDSTPSLSFLLCNFPKGTKTTPALMRLIDVRTFFHEFGHALHNVFGKTKFLCTSGTNTKLDFVEMPSQLLEEWLKDPKILQMISSHYKTKEKLPLEIIDKMKIAENVFSAGFYMRQLMLSNYALQIHLGDFDNQKQLWKSHRLDYQKEIFEVENDNYYAAFGHLNHYAACYYGYLWSKVFAQDLFEQIQKEGLLNPLVGKRYKEIILKPGGSKDPNQLLKDFLGREPNNEAFFRSIESSYK